MNDDMVDWLRQQLDAVEAAARAATPGPWSVDNESYAESIHSDSGKDVVSGGRWGGEASVFSETEDALHIARHDPTSVLADIASKRDIVLMYEAAALSVQAAAGTVLAGGTKVNLRAYGSVVRQLAQAYAHRPGYKEEWRPNGL